MDSEFETIYILIQGFSTDIVAKLNIFEIQDPKNDKRSISDPTCVLTTPIEYLGQVWLC
jgi:hypothetical protein